jgi:photosystem II stability/assembly factor-like uncharacterized protein
MLKHVVLETLLFCFLCACFASGQWVLDTIPGVSTIWALAEKDGNLFAGTNAGVFFSADSAKTWIARTNGLAKPGVSALAVQGDYIFSNSDSGVFRSSDNGKSWEAAGTIRFPIKALAVDGANLFAGSADTNGVFLSSDYGATWRSAGLQGNSINCLFAYRGLLYAGSNMIGGVFLSADNGVAWNERNNGLATNESKNVCAFAIINGTTFMGAGGGLYRSADSGQSWTSTGIKDAIRSLAVSGNYIFAGYANWWQNGFRSSNDGGETWTLDGFNNFKLGVDLYAIVVSNGFVYAGNNQLGIVFHRPLSDYQTSVQPGNRSSHNSRPILRIIRSGISHPFYTAAYALAEPCFTSFSIYTSSGKHVYEFDRGFKDAGHHKVGNIGNGLAGGLYQYRFKAGNHEETGRLLIQKN